MARSGDSDHRPQRRDARVGLCATVISLRPRPLFLAQGFSLQQVVLVAVHEAVEDGVDKGRITGRERVDFPRIESSQERPLLAHTGLSERSLTGLFPSTRPHCVGGPRKRPPAVSCGALRFRGHGVAHARCSAR